MDTNRNPSIQFPSCSLVLWENVSFLRAAHCRGRGGTGWGCQSGGRRGRRRRERRLRWSPEFATSATAARWTISPTPLYRIPSTVGFGNHQLAYPPCSIWRDVGERGGGGAAAVPAGLPALLRLPARHHLWRLRTRLLTPPNGPRPIRSPMAAISRSGMGLRYFHIQCGSKVRRIMKAKKADATLAAVLTSFCDRSGPGQKRLDPPAARLPILFLLFNSHSQTGN